MGNNNAPIIRYSQCWEDTELMLSALDVQKEDIVFSITSGGCNTLSILSTMAKKLVSVDLNPAQTYLLELKKISIEKLDYNNALEFLGIKESNNRLELFESLHSHLNESCKKFWESNTELIQQGIIHSGKFENYLNTFRKYILSLIHSKKNIDTLLSITDNDFQKIFYDRVWNNNRWRSMFKIFFSKAVMKNRGRSKEMFEFTKSKSVGKIYYNRCEKAFSTGILNKNRYMEYIMKGNYKNSLPFYLEKENYESIRERNNISIVTSDILSYLNFQPNNSISKFNLSDIFESMSQERTDTIFKEIYRTATDGARVIFWNNLVKREIPENYKPYFISENDLIEKLKQQDKVFFYDHFKIYTIKK